MRVRDIMLLSMTPSACLAFPPEPDATPGAGIDATDAEDGDAVAPCSLAATAPECRVCGVDGAWLACPFGCRDGHCIAARSVVAGEAHACARFEDGEVVCWGDEALTGGRVALPFPASAIAAARRRTCALGPGGEVACWGEHALRQVTLAGRAQRLAPSTGERSCALMEQGEIACWDDAGGVEPVAQTPHAIAALALGDAHGCAIDVHGKAWCWGRGEAGQLGDGLMTSRAEPLPVEGLDDVVLVGVMAGGDTSCAWDETRALWCWGGNAVGQAGVAPTEVAVAVPTPTASRYTSALLDGDHGGTRACVLDAAGVVRCWGDPGGGALGPQPDWRPYFAVVVPGLGRAVSVAVGAAFGCAVDELGVVRCWGADVVAGTGDGAPGVPRLVTEAR